MTAQMQRGPRTADARGRVHLIGGWLISRALKEGLWPGVEACAHACTHNASSQRTYTLFSLIQS